MLRVGGFKELRLVGSARCSPKLNACVPNPSAAAGRGFERGGEKSWDELGSTLSLWNDLIGDVGCDEGDVRGERRL